MRAAAVVIPKSMAYASIASLPLQVGLYTAFLPMIIYRDVLSMVQKSSLGEALGREGMHFNLETAVTKYLGEAAAAR